jgi:hypothetical protein
MIIQGEKIWGATYFQEPVQLTSSCTFFNFHELVKYSKYFRIATLLKHLLVFPFVDCNLRMLPVWCSDRIITEHGAVGLVRISIGNQSTWRKPVPLPFFPPQILCDLSWDWTQDITVGSQQLIYLSYGTALNNLFIFSLFSNSRPHSIYYFIYEYIQETPSFLWGI